MRDLGAALGLALVIEGVLCLAFPDFMRRMAVRLTEVSPTQLRIGALVSAVVGLGLVWAIRRGL